MKESARIGLTFPAEQSSPDMVHVTAHVAGNNGHVYTTSPLRIAQHLNIVMTNWSWKHHEADLLRRVHTEK